MVEVIFASEKLKRCYEASAVASRHWGAQVAHKYISRINALYAARAFSDLFLIKSFRLHQLKGGRQGQYAITLLGRWRLVLVRVEEDVVRVEEVTNHYGD